MNTHKALLLILLLIASFGTPVHGQQGRKLTLQNLASLLEEAGQVRILGDQALMDTLMVEWNGQTARPLEVLTRALEGHQVGCTEFEGLIVITSGKALRTSLPEDFIVTASRARSSQNGAALESQVASNENRLYQVGTDSGKPVSEAVLTGTVLDFRTGDPLAGVTLFIEDPWTGATTDRDGHYSITLPRGRHSLRLSAVGQEDTFRQILLQGDGSLDISMNEKVIDLEEVAITARRLENVRGTTMGMARMRMSELKNIPTTFGEADILRAVMALPGVKGAGEISTGFNVRGGSSDQNLILLNGSTIFNPTHMFGLFSIFNSDLVSDMTLYKSSIPSKYGGRISSVLDITTKQGNSERVKGSLQIGLLTSGLALDGPIGRKTSFVIGGRLTYSDWILRQLPKSSGYSDGNAGYYDLNAGLGHRFSDRDHLKLDGYYSRDRFRFNDQERYAYENASASLRHMHAFSENHTMNLSLGWDHYATRVENGSVASEAYRLSTALDQLHLGADFQNLVSFKHSLSYGFQGIMYLLTPGRLSPVGTESTVAPDRLDREKALDLSAYLSDSYEISDKLSLEAGLRWNLYGALGPRTVYTYASGKLPAEKTMTGSVQKKGLFKVYQGPEIRLSARYEIIDDLSLKASLSTMRQNLHKISNTTIMSPTDTWKLSDGNIRPQKGRQASLGLYKNFDALSLETSLEGYYKTMDDYLDYRSGAILAMNHHIETDVLPSKGRSWGLELLVKRNQGKLNGWISYTWSRTQLRQDDQRIVNPVNKGQWYSADFDRPHDIKMVANYKFSKRVSVSMNMDYSTGRPVSIPTSKYKYSGSEYVYFSMRNQYRLPDNFRVDLSLSIEPSHHLTNLTHRTFQIGVYNLTGRKNVYSVYYTCKDGQITGYKLAIFGVPIPYVSYNIKF